MTKISDVLRHEYDSPRSLTLDDVAEAVIDAGLVNFFQEWHEGNDKSSIDISIRYVGNLQTEIAITVNGQEIARVSGWYIQRAAAAVIGVLDDKTSEPVFAETLFALLAEKESTIATGMP